MPQEALVATTKAPSAPEVALKMSRITLGYSYDEMTFDSVKPPGMSTCMMSTSQLTPTPPLPLSPVAPIMPLTEVPWPPAAMLSSPEPGFQPL